MDLFLNSLTEETESFVQTSIHAEHEHVRLQNEYFDIENMAKEKLIQSSLPLPISKPKPKPTLHINNKSRTCQSSYNTRPKSTVRKNSPSNLQPKRKTVSQLNRPTKTFNKMQSQNLPNHEDDPPKSQEPFLIQATANQSRSISSSLKPKSSKNEGKSAADNNLLFSKKPISSKSARSIVPPHPFIISPAMGGEGFDSQDFNHFPQIPKTQPIKNNGFRNSGSPFPARVFSERFNPNIPIDSELRCRPKDVIDKDIDVF